jgi:hypothetical protein
LDNLTSGQISEWLACNNIDPIGEWRNDSRIALICSTITNLFRWKWAKRGSLMTKSSDFMPEWNNEKPTKKHRKQSMEEMKSVLNKAFGFNKDKKHGN